MKIAINGEILEVSGLPEGAVPLKPFTKAEYDALTDAEKQADVVYAITDDGGSGSSSGGSSEEIYSTEETRIGTWIDGKPLYRKVFSFVISDTLSIPSTGLFSYQFFASTEPLHFTNVYGMISSNYISNTKQSIPYTDAAYNGSSISNLGAFINFKIMDSRANGGASLMIQGMGAVASITEKIFLGSSVEAVAEYTKTTDTGGAV